MHLGLRAEKKIQKEGVLYHKSFICFKGLEKLIEKSLNYCNKILYLVLAGAKSAEIKNDTSFNAGLFFQLHYSQNKSKQQIVTIWFLFSNRKSPCAFEILSQLQPRGIYYLELMCMEIKEQLPYIFSYSSYLRNGGRQQVLQLYCNMCARMP